MTGGAGNDALLVGGLVAAGAAAAVAGGALPVGADAHVLHARGLMMSNLGAVFAAQGRVREAEVRTSGRRGPT